jgi:cell wall-associated NlpC family hydrolase
MTPVPPTPGRAPRGRRSAALWRLAATLGLAACAGLRPAPRYVAPESRAGGDLRRDLQTRQAAYRAGDRSRLLAAVKEYLGVPYRWGGSTRQGMDCSAMTRAIFRRAYGLELPRTSGQMYRLGEPVGRRRDLRPGDLVFFRLADSGPGISHVGVYVGDGRFAHASASRGSVVDELGSPYFTRHYAGARRILP